MQELWQLGLSWDEDVPPEIKTKWIALFNEMSKLNQVQFPRCLTPRLAVGDPWLVVFCDASRLAFGACAYVRWQLSDGTFGVRFVAAKSRVAPLKELTIPRLELQSAVLASRLAKTILEENPPQDRTNNPFLRQSGRTRLDSKSTKILQAFRVLSSKRDSVKFKSR